MKIFVVDSHAEMLNRCILNDREMYSHEILLFSHEEMIPDAFLFEDLKSRAPFKGKNVSLADGFNPPPLKGRKHKYNR